MSYYAFNFIEAIFWIILGLSAFASLYNAEKGRYRQLAVYTLGVFIAFGLSDLAETWYGSFLEPQLTWLLVWKILNVLAIFYGFYWYFRLKTRP
jgi:hypothetical protein